MIAKQGKIYKYCLLALLLAGLIYFYQKIDLEFINDLFLKNKDQIFNSYFFNGALIFFLRSLSILFPILAGTYCSVLAGYLFGIKSGMILIFFADFFSCSSSFFISRTFGKEFISSLLGKKQMIKIETLSKEYLDENFFLMTGLLMTQFFDFVSYALGLTKVKWRKYIPALIISIIISDAPFVSGGYAIKSIKSISIEKIINGEVNVLSGSYLLIFILSVLIIFLLGILNHRAKKI